MSVKSLGAPMAMPNPMPEQMMVSCHTVMIAWEVAMLLTHGWHGDGAAGARQQPDEKVLCHLSKCLGGWNARVWLGISAVIAYNGANVLRGKGRHFDNYIIGMLSFSYLVIGLVPEIHYGIGSLPVLPIAFGCGGAALVIFGFQGWLLRLQALAAYPLVYALLALKCVFHGLSPTAALSYVIFEWTMAVGASWSCICYCQQSYAAQPPGGLGSTFPSGVVKVFLSILDALDSWIALCRSTLVLGEHTVLWSRHLLQDLVGMRKLESLHEGSRKDTKAEFEPEPEFDHSRAQKQPTAKVVSSESAAPTSLDASGDAQDEHQPACTRSRTIPLVRRHPDPWADTIKEYVWATRR